MKALHFCLILLVLVSTSLAGEWRIETVDSTDNVGKFTSLALDSSGYPHISYYDYTNIDLKYARWDGAAWRIETVDSGGDVGAYTSLALDSSDYPHISYRDSTNDNLKYARWDGDEWLIETVDSAGDVGYWISLALDDSGYPHISYAADYNGDLKYARWDGAEWRIETVDSAGDVGGFSSLALDSNNYPHISYNEFLGLTGYLKYARWDGAAWRIEIVDSTGSSGVWTSLALDSNDYPHISCSVGDDSDLLYARWDGAAWQIEIVDSDDWVGLYTSLAIDSNDYPHISYGYFVDYTDYDLKYARWDGAEWRIETVDSEGNVGQWTSLALDASDNPYISYYDGSNKNLKLARYEPNRFHLLSPGKGDTIYEFPFTFDWEDHDLDGLESYTLWWGTDPDFLTYNEVTDIGESEYTITGGIEDGARVWWRVKSLDSEGGEYWAEELDWYFDVDLGGGIDLADFGAGSTDEGVLVNWRLSGGEPAGVRVLRGEGEPEVISGNLTGDSSRYLDRGVEPGGSYAYWLEVTEGDGTVSRFGPTEAVTVPEETFALVLYAAYPSPSRDVVNFVYSLPDDGRVVLSVYDLSGRRVATLVDSELTAGRHEVSWNCAEIPSGVYLYRLETSAGSLTRRLVVSR
ncbi:MAG TPA: T9SS type A sorting domain-containing protein [bacterium]|nr:T9SS type A sorting domain-containing protein [bacterium]